MIIRSSGWLILDAVTLKTLNGVVVLDLQAVVVVESMAEFSKGEGARIRESTD